MNWVGENIWPCYSDDQGGFVSGLHLYEEQWPQLVTVKDVIRFVKEHEGSRQFRRNFVDLIKKRIT